MVWQKTADFERYRRSKRVLWTVVGLVLAVVFFAWYMGLFEQPHRGRASSDPSRIEHARLPASCTAFFAEDGQSAPKLSVAVRGVEPRIGASGVTAVVDLEVCNRTSRELRLGVLGVSYRPHDESAPGIDWQVANVVLGPGFCDELAPESAPLGELVRFRADDGTFEVYAGIGGSKHLHLPSCIPPTPVPSPTATPTATPTPLPELEPSHPRVTLMPMVMQFSQQGSGKLDLRVDEDVLLELRFGSRGDGGEEDDSFLRELPDVAPPGDAEPWILKGQGRPTCLVLRDKDRSVYLFVLVTTLASPVLRYLDAVEPVAMGSDSGQRRQGYKLLVAKGDTVHLAGFVVGEPKTDLPVNVRRFPLGPPPATPFPTRTPRPSPTPKASPTAVVACADDPLETDDWRDAPLLSTGRYQLRLCSRHSGMTKGTRRAEYSEVDWFRVQGREDEEIRAEVAFDSSRANVVALLETAPTEKGGQGVAESSLAHNDLHVLRYECEEDHVYYLVVVLLGEPKRSGVDYELRLFDGAPPPCTDDAEEENDDHGDATKLVTGTSTHHLCPHYNFLGLPEHNEKGYVDVDWYKLSAAAGAAGRSLQVEVSWSRPACNLDLDLYMREHGLRRVVSSAGKGGKVETVSYPLEPSKRTYYAVVKLVDGASCLDKEGVEYTLTVSGAGE